MKYGLIDQLLGIMVLSAGPLALLVVLVLGFIAVWLATKGTKVRWKKWNDSRTVLRSHICDRAAEPVTPRRRVCSVHSLSGVGAADARESMERIAALQNIT